MAWPANLAPTMPSVYYDARAVDLTLFYVLVLSKPYLTIQGAKSMARIDLPFYDNSLERDEIFAPQIGRSPMNIIVDSSTGAGALTVFTNNGDSFSSLGSPDTATNVLTDDTITTLMKQSDAFTHTAPHQNILAQTMVRFFDGPVVMSLPTGNIVGECDANYYLGFGTQIPQYPGSAPPKFSVTP